jgi:hypothetical protein
VGEDRRTVAGRYTLLTRLGSGGMGTVWRAQDVVLGRDVAVKEVSFPNGVSDDEREVLRERTRREARAAARLDHPSAVTVYDVVEEDGVPYLVMELVEARTLSEIIRTDGPLSPRVAAHIGLAVLGALEAAHAQGIVHRDVKPGNVLIAPPRQGAEGRVVLTDFGIATFTGDSSLTSTGLLLGSPSYIAPERARGQQPGPASDLWCLGATLFAAVEGRPPYDKGEPLSTLTAVVAGEHAPFVASGPLVPLLEGLLVRDPELRIDAAEARRRLEQVLRSAPVASVAPAPVPVPAGVRRSEQTTALGLEDVREEVRQEKSAAVPAQPARAVGRGAHRSRTPLVLTGIALAVVAAVGVAVSTMLRSDDHPATTAGGSGDRTSAAPPASPSAAGSSATPAGWQTYSGPAGWTAAVPAAYAPGTFTGDPEYKDPATRRLLRVSTTPNGRSDPVQDRRNQAAAFARTHAAYKEIAITATTFHGFPAADWEFTYSSGGASLRVLNRVFVVNGRGYSLYFQTHTSDDWPAARADFERMAAAFRPASSA